MPNGTPICLLGSESLIELLTSRGHVCDPANARVVIVGLDQNLTYHKLRIAGQRVLAGADFIGTNADRTFPMPGGEIVPGAGSLLAAVEAMTGQQARIMGKPEATVFQLALERLGTTPARTLMIGDRLDTDILGAQRAGLVTALVLSGVSTQAEAARGDIRPNGIFAHLGALLAAWQSIQADVV